MRLHVGCETDLDGNAEIVHIREQIGIFPQARTMTDAARVSVVYRLLDRYRSERFAGVHGDWQIRIRRELKRLLVLDGRVTVLRAGEVEADDAAPAERDGYFVHALGMLESDVAQRADDDAGRDLVFRLGTAQADEHSINDLLVGQTAARVQLGAEAD